MTDTKQGGARPRPEYRAEKVDAIPADVVPSRKTGPRTDPAFTAAMEAAMNDPGAPYCVATFQSRDGAKTLHKKILDGKVKTPKGSGVFDIAWRRVTAPDGATWSKLYATYSETGN